MKTKQLANILIKILGLSVLVHSIPAIINGVLTIAVAKGMGSHSGYWFLQVPPVVSAAIGICLIIKSRDLAAFLFRGEDE